MSDRIPLDRSANERSMSQQEFFLLMDAYSNIKEMYVCILNNQASCDRTNAEVKQILTAKIEEIVKIVQTHERSVDDLKVHYSSKFEEAKRDLLLTQADIKESISNRVDSAKCDIEDKIDTRMDNLEAKLDGRIDNLLYVIYGILVSLVGIVASLVVLLFKN